MDTQPGRKGMRPSHAVARSIFSMNIRGMRVAQKTMHWTRTKNSKQTQL